MAGYAQTNVIWALHSQPQTTFVTLQITCLWPHRFGMLLSSYIQAANAMQHAIMLHIMTDQLTTLNDEIVLLMLRCRSQCTGTNYCKLCACCAHHKSGWLHCFTSLGGPDRVLSPAMVMTEMSSGIAFAEKLKTYRHRRLASNTTYLRLMWQHIRSKHTYGTNLGVSLDVSQRRHNRQPAAGARL